MPLALIEGVRSAAVTSGTAGVTTQTFDTGLPFIPVAAEFKVSRATADNTAALGMIICQGFTDGTNEAGTGAMASDGSSSSGTTKVAFDDAVIRLPHLNGSTFEAIGSFDAFVTGGVRIIWDQIPSAAYIIHVTLWFGDNVSAACGVTDPPASATPSDVTIGFEADHIMFACTGSAFNEAHSKLGDFQTAHVVRKVGTKTAITRFCSHQSENAKTTSEQHVRLAETGMVGALYRGGVLPILNVSETHIGSIKPEVFTLFSAAGLIFTQGPTVAWLAISYGGRQYSLENYNTRTTTGVNQYKSDNFVPWAALTINTQSSSTNWTDDIVTGDAAFTSYGGYFDSSGEERVLGYYAEDNATTTSTKNWSKGGETVYARDNSDALLYEGNASPHSSNGMDIDFSTVDATARAFALFQLERDTYTATSAGVFPLLQVDAVAVETITGTSAGVFPLLQVDAVATQAITATAAGTFPLLEANATGLVTFTLTGAGVFPLLTVDAVAEVANVATSAGVFPLLQVDAVAVETITGSSAGVFPLLQVDAVAGPTLSLTSAGVFPLLQVDAVALVTFTITGAGLFPLLQVDATARQCITATSAGVFPLAQVEAVARVCIGATSAGTFPLLTMEGTIGALLPVTGTSAGVFPLLQMAAVAVETFTLTGAGLFPLLQVDAVALVTFTITGAGLFPLLQVDATARQCITATAAGTFPLLEVSAAACVVFPATSAGTFPLLEMSATAALCIQVTSAGLFPLLQVYATNTLPLGCVVNLDGSYTLTGDLLGVYNLTTDLLGSYKSVSTLDGDYSLTKDLSGDYDGTTDMKGGTC